MKTPNAWIFLLGIVAGSVRPISALAAQTGNLFVSDYRRGNVHEFGADGTDLGTFAIAGSFTSGLAFDSAGNLFVASENSGGPVDKFSPDGAYLGMLPNANLEGPRGMTLDKEGNLYVGNFYNSSIRKFSATGEDLGTFAKLDFMAPNGLAFDHEGNLFVADGDYGVQEFGPTGDYLGVFTGGSLDFPFGLAFDANDNLYVSLYIENVVRKFDRSGHDLGIFASSGLQNPYGLAFDSNGNLFVANEYGHTIREFGPTGADLGVFADTGDVFPSYIAFAPAVVPEPSSGVLLVFNIFIVAFRARLVAISDGFNHA
jgi:sugar lactone lactonase YvrE